MGSPFSVAVKVPVEKLGTPILTLRHLGDPGGVAVTEKGEVVVTHWDMHCVSVFISPRGKKLFSFGRKGSGVGEFISPNGIALDGEGNVIIADPDRHRIQKFTVNGRFLQAVQSRMLLFDGPHGVAFSACKRKCMWLTFLIIAL